MIRAQTQPAPAPVHHEQDLRSAVSKNRLILILVGTMLGMLLSALDSTIVGTAMPRVIAELNGLEHYTWVFTAYMLASTVMVPVYGKLSDIYGRRPFFLGGMGLFLLGSALSGVSQNMPQLIAFRALQGLGAGAIMPIVQAIIGDAFPPSERGKWQGIMMAVFGISTIVGPTAGGWITDNWGWRWVFYVNMPLGLIAILTTGLAMPGVSRRRAHTIDYWGALTMILAAIPLLLAFSSAGTDYPWLSPQILGLLAFAVTMFVVFFLIESRAVEPIINPAFFKNSIFTVSVVAAFLLSAGMFGATLFLPLFVQAVIGESATNSGAVLTPMMLGFVFSSIISGQIVSRTGRYKLLALISFASGAAGMFLLSRMDATATSALVVRNMAITGLGLGVGMSLFTMIVQNAFPFKNLVQVTASLVFFRSIGGTISAAILGSVMINRFQSAFMANLPDTLKQVVPPERLEVLRNPQVLLAPGATAQIQQSFATFGPQGQVLFQQLMEVIRTSLSGAITSLFLVSTLAMAGAFVATLFLQEIPLRKSHREPEPVAAKEAETPVAETTML